MNIINKNYKTIMKSTKVQTLGSNIGTFGLETPLHAYVLGIQGSI